MNLRDAKITIRHDTSVTPVQIAVAFHTLNYCRSLTDPDGVEGQDEGHHKCCHQCHLNKLERGMEAAALNLIRNYLNGETNLDPYYLTYGTDQENPGK